MDDTKDPVDSWLVRDNGNRIRGPFRQHEIVQQIKKGQLKGKTEIARANSYWFAIEEKAELARFMPEFKDPNGKPPPEQPTQMTATLTEAGLQDHGVEHTQFVATPAKAELAQPGEAQEQSIEWLSDEMAQEFGEDFGQTISVQTDVSGLHTPEAPAQEPNPLPEQEQPTPVPSSDEKARMEMLKRATVKADTLPSEHKSFQGNRPKPIDALMKVRNSGSSATQPSATVNVPVEPEPAPKMFMEEPESKVKEQKRKRAIALALGALVVAGLGAAAFVFMPKPGPAETSGAPPARVRKGTEAAAAARNSIILFDLEGAKSALSDLEQDPAFKGDASLFIAQALVKKEFLFDAEGASLSLQAAKGMARNKRTEAELDNLLAIYSFDREAPAATEMLRRNLESFQDDPVFRYNLALSLVRSEHPQEAVPILDSILASPQADDQLAEDSAVALGWALERICAASPRDPLCRRSNDAEEAFQRGLQANPYSPKARLGLGLYRLRRGGIKSAESDFRAFLDSAPDLDPPTRISNFRKLSNSGFYDFAHAQIVELNTPGPGMSKSSPLLVAAVALISGTQLKTSDAERMLDGALSAAPGEANVLKVSGYLRWKDGRMNELVDTLKDLKERNSFALNLMLGKAYQKLHKNDLAEKHFRAIIEIFPNRSEGHSLLGDLLLEVPGKTEEAKQEFQQALKKDPLDLVAWRGLQRSGVAVVLSPEIQKNLPF